MEFGVLECGEGDGVNVWCIASVCAVGTLFVAEFRKGFCIGVGFIFLAEF